MTKKMKLRFDFEDVPILKTAIDNEEEFDSVFSDLKTKLFGRKR